MKVDQLKIDELSVGELIDEQEELTIDELRLKMS